MNKDFNVKFMTITRELASSLYTMNRMRLSVAPYVEFSESYDQVSSDYRRLVMLLQTISGIELQTSTMKAYLRGLSCQLEHEIERDQIDDIGRQFVYPFDPYEESFKLYRELVLSGGRSVSHEIFFKK